MPLPVIISGQGNPLTAANFAPYLDAKCEHLSLLLWFMFWWQWEVSVIDKNPRYCVKNGPHEGN
jgi:hypothetical protein